MVERDGLRKVDMTYLADRFGISCRTLRRRLAEEGTSYDEIVDGVRLDLLKTTKGAHVDEVALRLGFSYRETFQRWHRKRFGRDYG